MKKEFIKYALTGIILNYSCFVFYLLDFDVTNWEKVYRFTFILFVILYTLLSIMWNSDNNTR